MVTVMGVAISKDNFRMKNWVMQKIIFLVNPLTLTLSLSMDMLLRESPEKEKLSKLITLMVGRFISTFAVSLSKTARNG